MINTVSPRYNPFRWIIIEALEQLTFDQAVQVINSHGLKGDYSMKEFEVAYYQYQASTGNIKMVDQIKEMT